MPTDPIASANALSESLRENTKALQTVRNRYRIVAVFLAMTIGLLLFTLYSRHETRESACVKDYDLRSGLLHVADMLEAFDQPPRNPETVEFIASLRADFALPNCDIPWI